MWRCTDDGHFTFVPNVSPALSHFCSLMDPPIVITEHFCLCQENLFLQQLFLAELPSQLFGAQAHFSILWRISQKIVAMFPSSCLDGLLKSNNVPIILGVISHIIVPCCFESNVCSRHGDAHLNQLRFTVSSHIRIRRSVWMTHKPKQQHPHLSARDVSYSKPLWRFRLINKS